MRIPGRLPWFAAAAAIVLAAGAGLAQGPVPAAAPAPAGPAGAGPDPAADTTWSRRPDPGAVVIDAETEGRPISRIEIVPLNIFEPVREGRFAFVFRTANRLHIRTRERTIEEQLLFRPGDPWSDAIGHESTRNLRTLGFLVPSHITAEREGDSVVVRVETRDVWSTRPEFDLESAAGKQYGSFAFTERNFAGLGKSFSVAYRELPDGRSREILYSDPSVLGSRWRLRYGARDGASGAANELSVALPYYAEDAPRTYGVAWFRETSVYRLFERGAEVASLNRKLDETEIFYGRGVRRDGIVARLKGYYTVIDRRLGPTQAAGAVPEEFLGGEESQRLRRIGVEGRLWRPRFVVRTRVNGFGIPEDFDLGRSLVIRVGIAPEFFGSTQDEGYLRTRLDLGADTRFGFGTFTGQVTSNIRRAPQQAIAEMDAQWVYQARPALTSVAAARGIAAHRPLRDFQATAGGLNGLRAYPVNAVAGTQLWRFNFEQRWVIGENYWENLTVGAVAFTDVARAWGAGSAGSEWFVASGAGLRLSLPQWSLGQVLRFDIAWPIEPSRDERRQPVLTFGSSQAF